MLTLRRQRRSAWVIRFRSRPINGARHSTPGHRYPGPEGCAHAEDADDAAQRERRIACLLVVRNRSYGLLCGRPTKRLEACIGAILVDIPCSAHGDHRHEVPVLVDGESARTEVIALIFPVLVRKLLIGFDALLKRTGRDL